MYVALISSFRSARPSQPAASHAARASSFVQYGCLPSASEYSPAPVHWWLGRRCSVVEPGGGVVMGADHSGPRIAPASSASEMEALAPAKEVPAQARLEPVALPSAPGKKDEL